MAGTDEAAVRRGFRLALQREPSRSELEGAKTLIEAQGMRAFCRALFNTNELLRIE